MQLILGLVLSAAIGLSLGLIGGGGSIITLPVLVYVIGVDAHQAVGMSLAVVGAASLIGSALHYRHGTVSLKTGALFGLSGMAGAYFGSGLTYLFSAGALLLSFATLMVIIAFLMLTGERGGRSEAPGRGHSTLKSALAGLVVGLLTGFLGVGGGFLIVPALVLFGGLAMKEAIGTSLMVIAINCAAGLAAHLSYGGFDLRVTALVTLLAAVGTLAGTALSHRAAPKKLRRSFAVFIIAVAVLLIAKNYSVLL
jgi:uncharacterized membrane protein YfcA